uniref:Zinc finger LSD1-type domain-containing protein n=1 Tax=Opuntia streptacantha TaxID=393608 RepID=A0A7C9E564_OPUST
MQSQVVCSGCRTLLLYPRGAPNVRCALCSTVTPVQPTGLEMDRIICGCCHTLLMYTRGATSVRCLCCQTVNLTNVNPSPAPNQVATVRCGSCQITLMYPYGAPSVKCAVCQYVTNVGSATHSQSQTVVVENPMSFDETGKLVSNVVVGVTTEKK